MQQKKQNKNKDVVSSLLAFSLTESKQSIITSIGLCIGTDFPVRFNTDFDSDHSHVDSVRAKYRGTRPVGLNI